MSSREQSKREARERREAEERAAAAGALRRRRLIMVGAALAAAVVVLVAFIAISSSSGGSDTPKVAADKPARGAAAVRAQFAGLPQRGLTLGRPSAPITLVEYVDLKCPVCQAYEEHAFPRLVSAYVRTGKLRVQAQVQDFVGNENDDSEHAARMALAAANQNRFYQFSSLFYRNQQSETATYVTESFLRSIGRGAGLDVAKALDDRDAKEVSHGLDEASRQFELQGFTGTPSFQLGTTGGVLKPFTPSSFADPKAFTSAIDQLLKE
jgi:protein-disulfide isomerase